MIGISKKRRLFSKHKKCEEIIKNSTQDYFSQTLSENVIKLCQLFHAYYEGETIIGHKEQDKKLNLLNHVYHNLKESITVLGIEYYACKQKMLNKPKGYKIKA